MARSTTTRAFMEYVAPRLVDGIAVWKDRHATRLLRILDAALELFRSRRMVYFYYPDPFETPLLAQLFDGAINSFAKCERELSVERVRASLTPVGAKGTGAPRGQRPG